MMDFMDSLKRGVDKAGFELDRLLRANRVRSRVNSLRSQMDEEVRQIGHHVVELYGQGELVQQELLDHCEQVKRLQSELAEREAELDAINREVAPTEQEPPGPAGRPRPMACPNCGATVPQDAVFCHRCGANVKAAMQTPPPPPESPAG